MRKIIKSKTVCDCLIRKHICFVRKAKKWRTLASKDMNWRKESKINLQKNSNPIDSHIETSGFSALKLITSKNYLSKLHRQLLKQKLSKSNKRAPTCYSSFHRQRTNFLRWSKIKPLHKNYFIIMRFICTENRYKKK